MKLNIINKLWLICFVFFSFQFSNAQLFGGQIKVKKNTIQIPANITLAQDRVYFIPSVFDQDYLPYAEQTDAASTSTRAADGTNDSTIDFQGTITTTGFTVKLPVTATGSGNLPAFSQTITIPSNLTQDGVSRDVNMSWAAQAYTSGTTFITVTIKAVGGTLNAKKLDLNAGIGSDVLGVLLGQFTYPYNSSGNMTTYKLRDIPGIPDIMFGLADNGGAGTANRHSMLYLPVTGEDGKIWLNNNLGANYSNINHPDFDLTKQATSPTDFNAYGSLIQWGRKLDGHELITWTSGTAGTVVSGTTTTRSNAPANALFITNTTSPYEWRSTADNTLWANVLSANNPCPKGFRVPTNTEFINYVTAAGITDNISAANSDLKFTVPGNRGFNGTLQTVGVSGFYWNSTTGTTTTTFAKAQVFLTGTNTVNNEYGRAYGMSVRCIMDTTPVGSFTLNCAGATHAGQLKRAVAASGVTTSVPYTNGNGGIQEGLTVTSTGVTGLTATLTKGFLATGAGNLVFTITGTPSATGTASFTFTINGQTCTFTRAVLDTTSRTLGSYTDGGCNSAGQGSQDTKSFGWVNPGWATFTLAAGTYRISYSTNITARGKVYTGAPNKPLQASVNFRIVNTSTGVAYLASGGGLVEYSGCTTRGVGDYSASGGYTGSSGYAPIPAGTYRIELSGSSYMGGCGSGGSDTWAACGMSLNNGTLNIEPQ